jgi:hypothetical protein
MLQSTQRRAQALHLPQWIGKLRVSVWPPQVSQLLVDTNPDNAGAVTGVDNQGNACGPVYAFSSVAAVESINYIKTG